ncbi:TetR family transcriptional regulator [Vibrio sp. CAIM 722]|uniref:TetR family transcriptional regulator n=2 Tax=Vibrio eleionomae TaxID=2653505 RepID=A0A7X4LM78_9VIBR|nr:TetR family transcriptional regulator [Vibrio eleionomae]
MNIRDKTKLNLRGRPVATNREARRQSILKSAYEAFVELGFAKTTTAEVARRARTSKRAIYEVFESKTALFAAVIFENQHLIIDLPRADDELLPIEETLFRIFRLDIVAKEAKAREAILRLLTRESILFPELTDYLYEHEVIRSRELLIEWLELEHSRSRLSVNDPELYAGMLMDIVFGALLPHRPSHSEFDYLKRVEDIKQRLCIIITTML